MQKDTSSIKAVTLKFGEDRRDFCDLLVERDCQKAMEDLAHESCFQPCCNNNGPYDLTLSIQTNKLVFHISDKNGLTLPLLILSLSPYRKLIKDYYMIVDSHHEAVNEGKPSRIEAMDMGRRALHNEGAELLMERLHDKIEMDMKTARRLFTLICVLHRNKTHVLR